MGAQQRKKLHPVYLEAVPVSLEPGARGTWSLGCQGSPGWTTSRICHKMTKVQRTTAESNKNPCARRTKQRHKSWRKWWVKSLAPIRNRGVVVGRQLGSPDQPAEARSEEGEMEQGDLHMSGSSCHATFPTSQLYPSSYFLTADSPPALWIGNLLTLVPPVLGKTCPELSILC